MMRCNKRDNVKYLPLALFVLVLVVTTNAQIYVNDECILANGNQGECTRFENCSAAIELVRNGAGRPQQCGWEGKHPIVCCEKKIRVKKRLVGDISKQICRDTYINVLAPTVTTSTTPKSTTRMSTTTEADYSGEISIADLIKQAEMEEEEQRKAGKPKSTVHTAAVGGVNAQPKEFPHMAVLGFGELTNITWACGGSLISDKYVLTAAHCISTTLGRVRHVRLGDLNLKLTTDDAKPQNFNIIRVIVHPGYKAPSAYNDIALIELSRSAIINDYVRPACLQTETDIPELTYHATGWGLTSYLGTPADHLQDVSLQPFTFEECRDAYRTTSERRLANGIDTKTQLCAGEDSKDTCQGDSGGPLQVRNYAYTQAYTVIGVTSFGKACGIGKGPSVYTRVSNYIDWIESIVWPQ